MRCLRFDPKMDQRAVTISNGTVFASAVADRNTNLKRWSPPFVNGKFIHGRMCSSAEQMMGQIVTNGPPQQTVKVERLITSFFFVCFFKVAGTAVDAGWICQKKVSDANLRKYRVRISHASGWGLIYCSCGDQFCDDRHSRILADHNNLIKFDASEIKTLWTRCWTTLQKAFCKLCWNFMNGTISIWWSSATNPRGLQTDDLQKSWKYSTTSSILETKHLSRIVLCAVMGTFGGRNTGKPCSYN